MTYLSLERRIAFVHVPRTGGTSILGALAKEGRSLPFDPHLRARDLRERVGPETWESLESIAVVRESFDWLRSTWRYIRGQPLHELFVSTAIIDFTEFARAAAQIVPVGWRQIDFLADGEGRPLIKHVIRFEHLAEDWARLAAELGLSAELPHVNASAAPAEEPLAEEDRCIAAAVFAEDALRFEFEGREYARAHVTDTWSRVAEYAVPGWRDDAEACCRLASVFLEIGESDVALVCARRAAAIEPGRVAETLLSRMPERLGNLKPSVQDIHAFVDRVARGVAERPYCDCANKGANEPVAECAR